MAINTAAGSKLYIGTTTAADTQQEYEADTYTQVGTIEDLGEFGDAYNAVTFESLSDARTQKYKGTADAGDINLVVGFDGSDSGQQALKTALDDTGASDYNFKVTLNDAGSGSPSSPTTFFFSGKVMSRRIQAGTVNNVVRANVTIGISTSIIEVAAV